MTASSASPWPNGYRGALSFSFDDGRPSQLEYGMPLFQPLGISATFYVMPGAVNSNLNGWREALAAGHEIGNHTLSHPCSGNLTFSRANALENYTLEKMAKQLDGATSRIEELLGVRPTTFAYPCGHTFVGRGAATQSYVPLVAERFLAGRRYMDSHPNHPSVVDLAQVQAVCLDRCTFDDLRRPLHETATTGGWLVLAGHDIGLDAGWQTTDPSTIAAITSYARENQLWIDTVANIATHVAGCGDRIAL